MISAILIDCCLHQSSSEGLGAGRNTHRQTCEERVYTGGLSGPSARSLGNLADEGGGKILGVEDTKKHDLMNHLSGAHIETHGLQTHMVTVRVCTGSITCMLWLYSLGLLTLGLGITVTFPACPCDSFPPIWVPCPALI